MTEPTTTEADRSTLATEYVSGGANLWSRSAYRTLPSAIDDITQDFGDDLYERMRLDATVTACLNVLRASIIEEGVRLAPAIDDPEADGYDLAQETEDFCEAVLADLAIPLDDVLWDLLDAILLGSRMAERIPVVYHRCVCWLFGARSNQPVSPGECVMAIAATIVAMAQPSRFSSSSWSRMDLAASSGYARL
jgi:hypothetical protein